LTLERKRGQRERGFTSTPLEKGPRATLSAMGLAQQSAAR
jgi:hypothetical protein